MRILSMMLCAVMIMSANAMDFQENEAENNEFRVCEVVKMYNVEEMNNCQLLFVKDSDGDIYKKFEDSNEEFEIGQEIVIEFNTCGTPDKTDDRIVNPAGKEG